MKEQGSPFRSDSADPSSTNKEAVVEFLQRLVRERSVNPPGDEGPVAEIIAAKLKEIGFSVELIVTPEGRPNVVGTYDTNRPGPTLLFNGHMDVLPAGKGWSLDPFGAEIVDDRLYGRGSLDMKAGLATALFACEKVIREERPIHGRIVYTAVADEVGGGYQGTGYLARTGRISADAAIVCEPTGPDVRIAHRGALWLELEITGRSAHGGRPWLGVNAISKASKVIQALEAELPALFAQRQVHDCLPAPNFNLGLVSGGNKYNLVADSCKLGLDRRLMPGESVAKAIEEVREIAERVRDRDDEEFQVEVREVMSLEGAEISAEAPIVRACQAAYRAITGEAAGLGCTAGFEDAHFLINDLGIPTAMFGPYQPRPAGDAQTTLSGGSEEHVQLQWLDTGVRVYARIIEDLLVASDSPIGR